MPAVYLDSSAVVKLVVHEPETRALRNWLAGQLRISSSALVRTEVLRVVLREEPGQLGRARDVLAAITLLAIDDDILDTAARLEPASLRTLDAIHIATALRLASDLDAVVTYDHRMTDGLEQKGLVAVAPA